MSDEKYQELKMLALKERTPVKTLLTDLIEDYLKKHGDGNPQFTLEQFEDPNFIACPAFYRDNTAWNNYMRQATPEELQKLKAQIIMIDHTLGRHI